MLLIDNDVVRRVLTPEATRKALETSYRDLARGEAVCRPRIDIRIPTADRDRVYQWDTMVSASPVGSFTIRIKSDIVFELGETGARTQKKYCSRLGLYCGLVLLTRVENAEPVAIIHNGWLQNLRVAA